MREDVNVSNEERGKQDAEMGTLLSSLRIIIHSSCQRGSQDKVDGKKKSNREGKKK
jgi:hypothetical protein